MAIKNFKLKVPATSANLGPGFDTLGVALSLYLTIEGTYNPQGENKVTFNCSGEGAELMPNDLEKNLITQCALFVLKNNGIDSIKGELILNIHNEIPLGRGLGSSGAAVVGGVILGDIIGSLELSQSRIIDFIQELEGHPDNVVPAYLGGLVASYVSNKKQDSEVFPPQDIVRFSHLKWSKNIKVIAVVPKYELSTSKARGVLPQTYSKQDVVS
jgi:homoserine kinase